MSQQLSELLNDFCNKAGAEHREWIERAATAAREMIEAGEPDIALENFCEYLIEWQCPLSQNQFDALGNIAQTLQIDAHVWQVLDKQIR